jgi:hypothetical protein
MILISSANIFIGSMSAGTLTVTSVQSGTLAIGQSIFGTNVPIGTTITGFVGGSGATGTYTVSSTVTVGSTSMSASSTYGNIVVYVRGGYRYYVTTNGTVTNGGSNYTIAPTTIGVVFPSGISNDGSTILGSGTLANPAVQIVANTRLDISPELLNKRITNMGMNLNNTTASSNASTGALIVSGGAGIGGNVNVDGILDIFNTTVSTSTATGALQVIGGAGIGGNTYVGGSIFAGGGRYKTQLIASNSTPQTLTSTDGKSWNTIPTSFGTLSQSVNSIAFGGGNNPIWMAGLSNGTIVTSLDGITWSAPITTGLTICNEVVWAPTFNMWFAGGGSSATQPAIFRSTNNGVSWTTIFGTTLGVGVAPNGPINGLVWVDTYLLAGSSPTTGNTIAYTFDGSTFGTNATTEKCYGKLRYGNGRFMMCNGNGTTGSNTVYNIKWSTNALAWTTVIFTGTNLPSGTGGVTDVAWAGGNTWMAVTNAATNPSAFLSTNNGTSFAKVGGNLPSGGFTSIVWNSTASIWVAAGSSGIHWSTDGSSWNSVTTITSARLGFSNTVPADNSSINTSTGAVVVRGGIGIDGDANITGILDVFNTTPSTSVATGALVVAGGAGFGKEVTAPSYNAISDSRIKTQIIDICGQSSLDLFRDLKPSEYKLIANPEKPKTYGFIAQEIMQTIPEAVTLGTDFVPSIYEMAFVDYDKTTVTLINKVTESSWNRIRISDKPYDVTEVIDDKTFRISKEIPQSKIELVDVSGTKLKLSDGIYRYKDTDEVYNGVVKNGVFVYGPEVPDFHSLNKDMIWTVTTRATQELDKQLQDARQRISVLENQVSELIELMKNTNK